MLRLPTGFFLENAKAGRSLLFIHGLISISHDIIPIYFRNSIIYLKYD